MLRKNRKKDARTRLKALEKRFDLSGLEGRLEQLGGSDLDKMLDKLDWKDLEKKLEKDVARRAEDVRKLRQKDEPSGSPAGFIAGLVIGALVGVVLAVLFGKQDENSAMDRFASNLGQAPTGSGFQPATGATTASSGATVTGFGDGPAIEREVTSDDDVVNTAGDTIDSASDDVREATEDIAGDIDRTDRPTGNL